MHENTSFITLTYSESNLVYASSDTQENMFHPTLSPKHLQNFIKRIRRSCPEQILRFYAVGEYGDRSWRPHYHLALFGYESCWHGETKKHKHQKDRSCCPPCDLLFEKWGFGGVDNARVENDSAGYIAGYVTKKLTKQGDTKLDGRYPEFSRMSRRPGIGALCINNLADALFSEFGKSMLTDHGDVPVSLRQGKRQLPLGRYLRQKLRDEIGSNGTPQEKAKVEYIQELRTMFKDHLDDPKIPKEQKLGLKEFIIQQDKQKILNTEIRFKLKQRKKLL